jgi:uncharacterized protein YeaO (DUF488 family)
MTRPEFRLKRVYLPPEAADGSRVLVDRLWPRGLSHERAQIDLWCRELAPSAVLPRRLHGERLSWEAFKADYWAELTRTEAETALRDLFDRLRREPVTLLFAARDEMHNNAIALKEWLDRRVS